MKTNEIDLRIEFQSLEKDRSAYRANIPGLSIRLGGGQFCSAKDLSAGGASFIPPAGMAFHLDQLIVLDILVAGQLYVQAVECVVVRTTPNITACAFRGLTRVQESRLDKLVLETQKRLIARRKAEEAKKSEDPERFEETPHTPEDKSTDPIRLDD